MLFVGTRSCTPSVKCDGYEADSEVVLMRYIIIKIMEGLLEDLEEFMSTSSLSFVKFRPVFWPFIAVYYFAF